MSPTNRFRLALLAAALLAAPASTASADPILLYDTTGQPGTQASQPPSLVAAGLDGRDLAKGSGQGSVASPDAFTAVGWASTVSGIDRTFEFLSFGFDVDPLATATVDSVRFRIRSDAGGPRSLSLYAVVDQPRFAATRFAVLDLPVDQDVDVDVALDVTVTSFLEIFLFDEFVTGEATGVVAVSNFRDPSTGADTGSLGLFGSVAIVPEPSGVVLCGLGLIGLAVARRRRAG